MMTATPQEPVIGPCPGDETATCQYFAPPVEPDASPFLDGGPVTEQQQAPAQPEMPAVLCHVPYVIVPNPQDQANFPALIRASVTFADNPQVVSCTPRLTIA